MLMTKIVLIFIALVTLVLVVWGIKLCLTFDKKTVKARRHQKILTKKSPVTVIPIYLERAIHCLVLMIIVALSFFCTYYRISNSSLEQPSIGNTLFYPFLILIVVICIHYYFFPVVNQRFLW